MDNNGSRHNNCARRTRVVRTVAAVATSAALLLSLAGCQPHATVATTSNVNIYEEEDLSGAPYSEPVSTLYIQASAGRVCYASDRTGQDTRQMYVDCNAAQEAGAVIAPAN